MSFAGPAFISYNHSDVEFAGWLAYQLLTHRVAVWFDEWEMKVGDSLRQKVQTGIDTSAYLIVVLSPDSVESEWVSQELDGALVKELEARRVFVLPILYRDCEIPLFLRSKLYADFRTDREEGLEKLLSSIDRSEVPGHGREAGESVFTDWTTDWKIEDGRHVAEIILNQHSRTDDWSIYCAVKAVPNEKLNERFQEYVDSGLEWFVTSFVLNCVADTLEREEGNTDVIYIDGASEAVNEYESGDPNRNMNLTISITARRLGVFSNMDTIFEYGSQIRRIVDEHNRRRERTVPPEEKERLVKFLIEFPIDDPYRVAVVGNAGRIWVPRSK